MNAFLYTNEYGYECGLNMSQVTHWQIIPAKANLGTLAVEINMTGSQDYTVRLVGESAEKWILMCADGERGANSARLRKLLETERQSRQPSASAH